LKDPEALSSTWSNKILPRDVIGDGWINGLKGVKSTDTHLMDYEYGREGRILILDVKGDSFTVELLKLRVTRVVDKHELANLFYCKYFARIKDKSNSHLERNG
jgi:hypothetical protein